MSMALLTVTLVQQISATSVRLGHSAESAQQGVASVEGFVKGVISPATAVTASLQSGSPLSLTSSSPCWGVSSPSPSGWARLSATQARSLGVVVANDYQMVWCGYPAVPSSSSSTPPDVFAAGMVCPAGSNGHCEVEVLDYGSSCNPGTGSGCSPAPRLMAQVQGVWCDPTYCQHGAPASPLSLLSPNLSPSIACVDTFQQTLATCQAQGASPPLFDYFSASSGAYSGATTSLQSINYAFEHQATPVHLDLANNESATSLFQIGQVVLALDEIGGGGPGVRVNGSTPITEVTDQILLPSQAPASAGLVRPCFSRSVLAYSPYADYPMNDSYTSPETVADPYASSLHATGSGFSRSDFAQPGVPMTCSANPGSIYFTGSSYVTTPPPLTSSWSPGSQLTVEAWFNAKSPSFSNNPRIVANDHTDVDYHGFQLQLNGTGSCPGSSLKGFGTGFFDVGNGKSQAAACWKYPLTAGTWYFYVGTYNGQSVNAYIDGQLVASTPYAEGPSTPNAGGPVAAPETESTCSNNTNPPVSIGYNPCYGTDHFNGNLADVAIYTTALTSAQIEGQYQAAQLPASYPNTCYSSVVDASSPVTFYQLDDTSTPAIDVSGQGDNTASGYGGVSATGALGPALCAPSATAMSFNGSTNYLVTSQSFPNPQSFPNLQTFTIEAWFKTSTSHGGIISFQNSQATGRAVSKYDRAIWVGNNGVLYFGIYNNATDTVQSADPPGSSSSAGYADGNWHFVAAVLSPYGMQLYADGMLVASNAQYTTAQNYTGWWVAGYFRHGGWPSNIHRRNEYLNGELADVAVFPTALGAGQIAAQYQAAKLP